MAETLDDLIRQRNNAKSPELQVFEVHPSPSTAVTGTSPSSSEDGSERVRDTQGDYVLWKQSGPNYDHVATDALRAPLPRIETTSPTETHMSRGESQEDRSNAVGHGIRSRPSSNGETLPQRSPKRSPDSRWSDRSAYERSNSPKHNGHSPPQQNGSLSPISPSKRQHYDTLPPASTPTLQTFRHNDSHYSNRPSDTLAKSPTLSRFITDGPPSITLAAMQITSPLPSFAPSTHSHQTLPSLDKALGSDITSPSHLTRTTSAHQQFGPPLTSVVSLPPMLSHHATAPSSSSLSSFITSRGRANSASTPLSSSDLTNIPTPALTWDPHSPSQYSTSASTTATSPSTHPTIPHHQQHPISTTNHHQQQPQPPPGTLYPCPISTCSAPPFSTLYLLNSHLNVHSQSRPHFCPVKSCPRGVGGQGFKRKNEMIRHGLVHTSPGYACPFCPDAGEMQGAGGGGGGGGGNGGAGGNGVQVHRYPRPDNLQRHVRVHHPEVERGDGRLRGVLEGGRGGRRRRGG